jgi:Asp-tRNA(Asn)/Glu-tRNA(Gln) amidotransferase A subunit family amidase
MAGSSELWKMDAVALARAIRTKQVSAVEVTEAALHHVEREHKNLWGDVAGAAEGR